ncbi:putative UDP-glucuronosyl/UDP-glucosyltransferase [Helianthus debilis subsp. tardiflorus]
MGAAFFTQICAVNSIYYQSFRFPDNHCLKTMNLLHLCTNMAYFQMQIGCFSTLFTNWRKRYLIGWGSCGMCPSLPSMYLDKRLLDDKDYLVNILNPKGSECMNWLNGKPKSSVVYLSFGSMTQPNPEQMKEITCALTDGGFSFLLVVKSCEEDKQLFAKLVLKTGLVVPCCPQLQVLAHESIGCFVTQCGLNLVLEAIGLGVPMVAMPQWSDQTTNAKYVEDVWGVGVRARPDANGLVSSRVLGSCIREVMEGEKGLEIKKNVMKWRDLAKEAIGEGGSSDS